MAKPKKPKSNKVKAWIWGVLNPVLDGLERQAALLHRGNLSWRHETSQFEYLYPPEEYLDRNGRDNLEDLYRFERGSELRERFARHQELLTRAAEAASTAFEALLGNPSFRNLFEMELHEYRMAHPENTIDANQTTNLRKLTAERIINGVGVLPENAEGAHFWNATFGELTKFQAPELSALLERKNELHESALKLIEYLRALRADWSDEFDVPVAPHPGISA